MPDSTPTVPDAAFPVPTQTADLAPEDRSGLPRRVGRYVIEGEIARGGMGIVLRARDGELGRTLAVKVLRDRHCADPAMARRFVEEAQVCAQLQHPGVPPVHELGTLPDGRPFFAMKLVKGHTLAELLRQRPDPCHDLPRFLSIFEQVCQTVAYAHSKGVIHRDLKPSNVMVGAFGEVQVMDWGLAKVVGAPCEGQAAGNDDDVTELYMSRSTGSPSETQPGSVLGTPAYMPPEQARGQVAHLDERCDVFGLGAILCEVLTGQPPYAGTKEELARRAAEGDMTEALRCLGRCGAEEELIRLALACLAFQPSARPRDAAAVAGAVRSHLDGVRERLRRAELAHAQAEVRARERRKRRLLWAALAALLLAGGIVWLGVTLERRSRQMEAGRPVAEGMDKARHLRDLARAIAPDDVASAERALQLWEQAAAEAARAADAARLGEVEAATYRRAADLVQELRDEKPAADAALDRARREQTLLKLLARARLLTSLRFDWQIDPDVAIAAYRTAFEQGFKELGAEEAAVRAGEPAAVARRLRGRPAPVRTAVLMALDEYADLHPPEAKRLRETADAIDDDPLGKRLRAAADSRRPEELLALAAEVRRDKGPGHPPGDEREVAFNEELLVQKVRVSPLLHLAGALVQRNHVAEAEALLRQVHHDWPHDFWVNMAMADCLMRYRLRRLEESAGYYRAAVAADPNSAFAHAELARTLWWVGDLDGAENHARAALRIDRELAPARHTLGVALRTRGDWTGAKGQLIEALRQDPNLGLTHANLGYVYLRTGDFVRAGEATRQAIELMNADAPLLPVVRRQLALCERLAPLEERQPGAAANPADLADFCLFTQSHAAAARHYADALRHEPKLAADVRAGFRYRAAWAAALAAAGRGTDAAELTDPERADFRKQALGWLRDDLKAWESLFREGNGADRFEGRRVLLQWQKDHELAGVRDAAALAKLLEAEGREWRQFWADVRVAFARGCEEP